MPTKQVMIGGQILHGPDRLGEWITENIEGWDEAPSVQGETEARPNADGGFDTETHYASRTPTIDGVLFAANRGQGLEAVKSLNRAARLTVETLSITDFGMTQWAKAKYAGVDFTWVKPSVLRWQLRLSCPDPFKYGTHSSLTTAQNTPLDIFHRGNADAWPVITVTGSMPGGYELMIDGRLLVVLAPLVSGQPHVINTRTRRITVGGSRVYGVFGISEPLYITPGLVQNFYALPKTSGSATFKVAYYDTYI